MPNKPRALLDRDVEWSTLSELWDSRRFELAVVLGRRRVGKSFTLAPFARAVDGIYYQATRRSETEQLETLTSLAAERFDDPALRHGRPFARWDSFFKYLIERTSGERFLLVLDEFPYLEAAAPGLGSVLQSLVDHELSATRFKLVLSGSHISAMKRLEGSEQPLYGRRTRRMEFAPFGCREAALFVPGYAPRDAIVAYGVFGGLPGHLASIDPATDLAGNVQREILDPGARLFDEALRVLDAFQTESQVHYSIIEAIARGEERWSAITGRVGASAGSLSRPMRWLTEMRLVDRVVPVTELQPQRTKRALYRLADPYLRFWHRFVSPLQASGIPATVSPAKAWKRYIEPHIDDYMGPIFERACRDNLTRLELPFEPARVGEWWSADSRHQIDVVAVSDAGELLVGECKWGGLSAHHLASLDAATRQLQRELGTSKGPVYKMLFTGQATFRKQLESASTRVISAGELLGRPR